MLVRSLPAIRSQVYEGLTFKDDTTSVQPRAYGDDGRVRHDDGRTACGRTATTGVRHGGNGGGGDGGDKGGVMGGHGGVLVPCTTLNWCREMGL